MWDRGYENCQSLFSKSLCKVNPYIHRFLWSLSFSKAFGMRFESIFLKTPKIIKLQAFYLSFILIMQIVYSYRGFLLLEGRHEDLDLTCCINSVYWTLILGTCFAYYVLPGESEITFQIELEGHRISKLCSPLLWRWNHYWCSKTE